MIIGQTIAAETHDGSGNDTIVFSPWFAREGDSMTSTVEVIELRTSGTLTVDVYHKDSEDTGAGSVVSVTGTNTFTTKTVGSFRHQTLKELVRYRVKLQHTGGGDDTVFCHFRILNPSFNASGAQSI